MTSHGATTIHPAYRTHHGLDDAACQLLDRRVYAVLGTENHDGTVHLAPVLFLYQHEHGRVLVETAAGTRKARNIAARPRASVLVQTPDAAWVCGSGPASIVRGTEATRLSDGIRAKYLTEEGQRACGAVLAELDDVTIVVTPTRWLGWDMGTLFDTLVARGADLADTERWFQADE